MVFGWILKSCNHHQARITKADKDFAKMLGFKGTNFPVKIRDIHKTEKNNSTALIILLMKIKKASNLCIKKCCKEKHVDLLLIGEEGERHCSYQRF